MLRLSDARMSGTSYGACVLHVLARELRRRAAGAGADRRHRSTSTCPRAASTCACRDEELARRRAAWTPPPPRFERGYGWMFSRSTSCRPNEGCDFDFLKTEFGAAVGEPAIY